MNSTVKVALAAIGATIAFGALATLGRAEASDLRVEPVPMVTGAEAVVRLSSGGRSVPVSEWIASTVAAGLVVLSTPEGVVEGALLFAVTKDRAKKAIESGYFRKVAG